MTSPNPLRALVLVGMACLVLASPATALFQDGDAAAAELAAQERERQQLLEQMTYVLVQQYMANARALEEQLDFESALREVQKARDLDPTDTVVLDYMRQLQALLGQPQAQSALLRSSARERYEAQRQQMKVLAAQDLAAARRARDVEDFDTAVTLAQHVVNRIEWSDNEIDWGGLSGEASSLLSELKQLQASQDERVQERKRRAAYAALQAEEELQVRQQDLRVQNLLVSATKAFDRADYETAQTLAEAVLDVDQHNSQAHQILDASQDAEREYADRLFIQTRREEFNRWRNTMERVRIPTADVYTDPDAAHWAEITAKRGSRASLGLGQDDEERQALMELLDATRMDADFDEKTIVEVANYISFTHDIPVHVDPEVVQELDDVAEFVTITNLRDVSVKSFLNVLVEQVGDDLAWTVRNGRVYITKTEKAQGAPITRVHPIQDLTFKVTNFKGPALRDIALPGDYGDDNESTVYSSQIDSIEIISPEEIQTLVMENVATTDWDSSDAYTIDFVDNNNLLVTHTPEVQKQVAEFLDDLRVYSTSMVTLESRFFAISDLFIEEIGTDLRGLDPTGPFADQYQLSAAGTAGGPGGPTSGIGDSSQPNIGPTQGLSNLGDGTGSPIAGAFYESGDNIYAGSSENFFGNPLGKLISTVGGGAFQFEILNSTELNIVMTMVSKSENVMEITAPTVSVYNTQSAFVTVINQISFVQGYEVDVATNAFIADPVIGVLQEGIVLDVSPTISYDRKYITLDVQTTVAELERPIPFITTLLGPNGSPVTFQLPALQVQDAQTTAVVPDGGAVILGGFKHVRYKNRTAEAPWFADIPILGFFFQEKGLSDEVTDLIIVIRAKITDFGHLREQPVAKR